MQGRFLLLLSFPVRLPYALLDSDKGDSYMDLVQAAPQRTDRLRERNSCQGVEARRACHHPDEDAAQVDI